jgi:hypothetical protein
MNPETNPLGQLLVEHERVLADGLAEALTRSTAARYRCLERRVLHRWTQDVVRALIESTDHDPAMLVSHIEQLAAERIAAGFRLEEIQLALTLLERSCWHLLVAHLAAPELTWELARLTEAIGAAKDQLARRYVQALEAGGAKADPRPLCPAALFEALADSAEPFDRP